MVRTDHDAQRCLMNLTESSGRLAHWRLRLAEFDPTLEYQSRRVHVVPYALSRLVTIGAPTQTVHDEISVFDDPFLLLRPHATTKSAPTPSRTVNGSPDDGVVLVSTRAQ